MDDGSLNHTVKDDHSWQDKDSEATITVKRKNYTAVQLKMHCGVAIGVPQCKFISTAVRFLSFF